MSTSSTIGALGEASGGFSELLATMARLRRPKDGCPWDLEQTHASLRHTLLEESYEALEALDSADPTAMAEELGDLLIQVVFNAQIGSDEGTFTIREVVRTATEKLRRRHPHVFGDVKVATADEVKRQWDAIKAEERQAKGQRERSPLDGVPKTMPALAYAQAVQSRAARAGLDGQGPVSTPQMMAEELARLKASAPDRREEGLGDLLFSLVGAAREMGVEAEEALRRAKGRFYRWAAHTDESGAARAGAQPPG